MSDWFGESPVEIQEVPPSHFYEWRPFCEKCDDPADFLIMDEGIHLCVKHMVEQIEDWTT